MTHHAPRLGGGGWGSFGLHINNVYLFGEALVKHLELCNVVSNVVFMEGV